MSIGLEWEEYNNFEFARYFEMFLENVLFHEMSGVRMRGVMRTQCNSYTAVLGKSTIVTFLPAMQNEVKLKVN